LNQLIIEGKLYIVTHEMGLTPGTRIHSGFDNKRRITLADLVVEAQEKEDDAN